MDPAQKLSRSQGRSPRAILASTFSDELSVFHAGKAKIFGISGKDRAAVSMAGHLGKTFWISTNSGDFVTSTYYYDLYPKWAEDWNAKRHADAYAGKNWALMLRSERYRLRDQDDRPYEVDLRGYGRVFPHNFGGLDNKLFYTRLIVSPIGDELTANFAETLIAAEQLGQDGVPNYLSASFSSIDAVNHFFGPSSLETEDNVLRLDRTLAGLLTFVDKSVGLKNTLIVLSADHGMAEMLEYMSELGLPAKRLYPKDLAAKVNAFAQQRFGIDKVTKFIFRPYLTLDQAAIKAAGQDGAVVEQAVAAMLTDIEGILAMQACRCPIQPVISRAGLKLILAGTGIPLIHGTMFPASAGSFWEEDVMQPISS